MNSVVRHRVQVANAVARGPHTPINVVVDPASTVIAAGVTDSLVTAAGALDPEKPPLQPVRPKAISGSARVAGLRPIIGIYWSLPAAPFSAIWT